MLGSWELPYEWLSRKAIQVNSTRVSSASAFCFCAYSLPTIWTCDCNVIVFVCCMVYNYATVYDRNMCVLFVFFRIRYERCYVQIKTRLPKLLMISRHICSSIKLDILLLRMFSWLIHFAVSTFYSHRNLYMRSMPYWILFTRPYCYIACIFSKKFRLNTCHFTFSVYKEYISCILQLFIGYSACWRRYRGSEEVRLKRICLCKTQLTTY